MKVGDKLYCHKDYIGVITGEHIYTAGHVYVIKYCSDEKNEISISTGKFHIDYRTYKVSKSLPYERFYYGGWFHTEKEYRKLKLEKLNEGRK